MMRIGIGPPRQIIPARTTSSRRLLSLSSRWGASLLSNDTINKDCHPASAAAGSAIPRASGTTGSRSRVIHQRCLSLQQKYALRRERHPWSSTLRRCFSTANNNYNSLYVTSLDDGDSDEEDATSSSSSSSPSLVALTQLELQYPSSSSTQKMVVDLNIAHAREGGHVLLAPNGTGKSLISRALAAGFQDHRAAMRNATTTATNNKETTTTNNNNNNTRVIMNKNTEEQFTLSDDQIWHAQAMAHVSFESHEEILGQRDDNGHIVSVHKTIARGGTLNKAAQFLVVRFGLYPLLHRSVDTLSTGEIRKTLLVRALAHRPRLLVLDNAFDGLDVPSRESLKDLVAKTLLGFRPDILVQGIDAKATAHTQVLLITHRPEEIVDPITTVTYYDDQHGDNNNNNHWVTHDRDNRTGEELLQLALGLESMVKLQEEPWKDPTLPSVETVASWWQQDHPPQTTPTPQSNLVEMDHLNIQRGDATLLSAMNWNVSPGQHWWIAGGNGAGKSTLSRLLARNETGVTDGTLQVLSHETEEIQPGDRRRHVGWVSTEAHMALARSSQTTQEVLTQHSPQHDPVPLETALTVLKWLHHGEDDKDDTSSMVTNDEFLQRPFAQLSQGEQKLVLIAAAIASRPRLLVLDEPCQGLDMIKRQRVLGVMERLCQATAGELSLIYITHHPEEVMPSINKVLHLAKGQDIYQGSRQDYDPDAVAVVAERLNLKNPSDSSSSSASPEPKPTKRSLV